MAWSAPFAFQKSSGILQNKKKSIISWAHALWPSEFHPAWTQRRHSAQRRANFLEVPFRGSAGPKTGAVHFMEWPSGTCFRAPREAPRLLPQPWLGIWGRPRAHVKLEIPCTDPSSHPCPGKRQNSCTLRSVFPAKRIAGSVPACHPPEGAWLCRTALENSLSPRTARQESATASHRAGSEPASQLCGLEACLSSSSRDVSAGGGVGALPTRFPLCPFCVHNIYTKPLLKRDYVVCDANVGLGLLIL